jgi:hypothetical protein
VAKLIEQNGDAKLTDLIQELAACPKGCSASKTGARRSNGQRLP